MSIKMIRAAGSAILALAAVADEAAPAAPRSGGTIAVRTIEEGGDDDPLKQISLDAVTAALGMKGFTILDDPDHAANIAEVVIKRTEVGSSLARGRVAPPIVTGMAVTIPTSRGKSVVVPMQRTELEIRVRRRGEQQPFWEGAAVTVRSADARNASAEQLATMLSQAAIGPYPSVVTSAISVP
jgi:hypothetical protein